MLTLKDYFMVLHTSLPFHQMTNLICRDLFNFLFFMATLTILIVDRQKIDGDSRQSLKWIFEVSSIDSVKMHKLSTGEMQFL